VFPPLNLAAGVRFRGALFLRAVLGRRMAVSDRNQMMREISVQQATGMSGGARKFPGGRFDAVKPYLATFLIVALLLAVWAGLSAA